MDATAVDKTFCVDVHKTSLDRIAGIIAESADLTADGFQAVLIAQHHRIGQVGVVSPPGFTVDQLFPFPVLCIQCVLDAFHQFLIQ